MKKILFTCFVFSIVAPAAVWAAPILLSELIDGALSYQSGNKTFFNFAYTPIGEMPPATEITVESIPDGIRFYGDFHDTPGGSTSDSLVTFDVDFGGDMITRANLDADLSVVGPSGIASITETFLPTQPDKSLKIFDFGNNSAMRFDSVEFDPPVTGLNVQKDIILSSNSADTSVSLTFFDQTFVVPEPGLGLVFAIAAIAIILAFREVQQTSPARGPTQDDE